MLIYPAIDLLDGSCVRLARGSFDDVTVYAEDPVEQAERFAAEGSRALHVVDLDGARSGEPAHLSVLSRIRGAFSGFLQTGGGLRTERDIERCLELGIDRVILGTEAASRPGWLAGAVSRFGANRIAAAVDLRGDEVMIDGWLRSADGGLGGLMDGLSRAGIETIVFTDTLRDGMLGSADADRGREFVRAGFETIVAGGVTTVDDVRRLRTAGAAGAIIGSALYEGRLALAEAIEAAGKSMTSESGESMTSESGESVTSETGESVAERGVDDGTPAPEETPC
ncbi:MAG: HisA/HisF-related TIM barrel protein [Gemmatimonadota bacterium]